MDFGAKEILVGNLLPLGCTPALLTLYPGKIDKYNRFGCLSEINQISVSHNRKLEAKVVAFRAKYPSIKFYLADFYGVYNAVLSSPSTYSKYPHCFRNSSKSRLLLLQRPPSMHNRSLTLLGVSIHTDHTLSIIYLKSASCLCPVS